MIKRVPVDRLHKVNDIHYVEVDEIKQHHTSQEMEFLKKHGLLNQTIELGGSKCVKLIVYQRLCALPFSPTKSELKNAKS